MAGPVVTDAGAVPVSGLPPIDWSSWSTPFVLFTGKGGVGKTTIASAFAIHLADAGRRVLLVSTDPASNLADVFSMATSEEPTPVPGVDGLDVMDLDPQAAADAYRARVLAPLLSTLPEADLREFREQLAGSCTVEIAAFEAFTTLLADPSVTSAYDHIVFDTAPTGHTLRLLSLPAAWSDYLARPDAASCLGPRAGLAEERGRFEQAVDALVDRRATTVVLVTRPERAAIDEASRAAGELATLGIDHQHVVVNGVLVHPLPGDPIAEAYADRQRGALGALPESLASLPRSAVALQPDDLVGVATLRRLVRGADLGVGPVTPTLAPPHARGLDDLVDELAAGGPGAILVTGKGGVGKTAIAVHVAVGLARRGLPVHLSTTDPAGRFRLPDDVPASLVVTRIDPSAVTADYVRERLRAAGDLDVEGRALLEEDLRSPCTQETAVFRAFSRLLGLARDRYVVIDTAPTGHTLLLLDVTGAAHRQVMRDIGPSFRHISTPLTRLQDPRYSRLVLVTLAETTPVAEAADLQDDLRRAGIEPYGWVVNASLAASGTADPVLAARARLELAHLGRIDALAARTWLVPWDPALGAAQSGPDAGTAPPWAV